MLLIRANCAVAIDENFTNVFIDGCVEQGRVKGLQEGWEEGSGEGRQEALVSVLFAMLAARDFTVLDQVRALIRACTDPAQLETWATRAATAQTIDEVFA